MRPAVAMAIAFGCLPVARCVLPEVAAQSVQDAAVSPTIDSVAEPERAATDDTRPLRNAGDSVRPESSRAASTEPRANAASVGGAGGDGSTESEPPPLSSALADAGPLGDSMSAAGAAGTQAEPAESVSCTPQCGLCSRCLAQSGACERIVGEEDPEGCQLDSQCSGAGHCLYIDQAMNSFNARDRFTRLDASSEYAQTITFETAGVLEEVRALFYCERPNRLPGVTVHNVADDGTVLDEWPSAVGVVVLNEDPTQSNKLQAISLATPFAVEPGDRVALVIRALDASDGCWLAINPTHTYDGGVLRLDGARQPGAMVFQALIAR